MAIFLVGGIGYGPALQGVPAISALIRGLTSRFDVTVFVLAPPDEAFHPPGYRVRAPPHILERQPWTKTRWPWLAGQFLVEHARQPFDALFAFGGYPMGPVVVALGETVRRPTVVTLLGAETAAVPSIRYGQLRRPWTRRLVLETCARATTVVVLSEHQRDRLRQEGLGRSDVEVIPFGADRDLFPLRRKELRPPLKLLHVANLTAVKDQPTLIRGFAILRKSMEAKLRIVGPDYLGGKLQRLVRELGLVPDIEFMGPVEHASLWREHEWADMFVLTSLSEGHNSALAEAAMSGLLLVSTPVGCVHLGESGAVVVPYQEPAALAAGIRDIVSDRDSWDTKVAYARAWVERHDARWTTERVAEVIRSATPWT